MPVGQLIRLPYFKLLFFGGDPSPFYYWKYRAFGSHAEAYQIDWADSILPNTRCGLLFHKEPMKKE